MDGRHVLRNEQSHFSPGLHALHRLLGRGAVEWRAEGATVELSDGRTILDFGSYAVTLLGHRPERVVAAVREALERLPTSTRLLPNPDAAELASRLASTVGENMRPRVVLGLNGSDVVEASLKLAMAATRVPRLIAVRGGFHGKTFGSMAVTDDVERRRPFRSLVEHVRFVEPAETAVDDALRDSPAAAVIVEPIQGEGGGRSIPPEVLHRWCDDVHRHGGFFIADEIQVGLRRCGPMAISQDLGVAADAVLLGKALGGGVMPLSAALCSEELYRPLLDDPFFHTSTFGGHPLSCAAGLAALTCIEESTPAVARLAPLLRDGLQHLGSDHPGVVTETRSFGLFGVIEASTADAARLMLVESARRGLLLAPCLSAGDTLRMLPPAVASPAEIEQGFALLDEACAAVRKRVGGRGLMSPRSGWAT